jgi:hypothetical protein
MRERLQDCMVIVDTTCRRRLRDEFLVGLHDVLLAESGDCRTGLRSAWSRFTAIDSERLICITSISHMLSNVLNRTVAPVPLSTVGLQICDSYRLH